jgi:hypothetical protein
VSGFDAEISNVAWPNQSLPGSGVVRVEKTDASIEATRACLASRPRPSPRISSGEYWPA